ncbi:MULTISPECIES: winged helix-turn-helix transcriptional regulator [Enterobacteriaceae]|jgi:Mn-dependent DtxR family transcriptional regulator|uniref:winged helix-turn-helix transcriptional regulator n=2 Tax=Enterobacteriaceae TaxID=543 RepID=UPI0003EE70F7|nr:MULTISPECIES: helix-turn-helix domain-containing protein [Enterobacteriaceae]EAS3168214.1 MarR family transcriptional regulator [Salmonella enterica]KAE9912985.1 winged helix-turn-helix transcriptional regulator [Enterobacteriaceae bacterium TzEc051]MBT9743657.1 winged helix-turn-helix transcriptional regulator [Enterobacteriaceae bacterium MCC505]MCU3671658.1 winged helix-turn-helix transcriptional regulator [Enterobacter hormaechei subsp. oharae]TYF80242.1 MarR family transcriptional regu
MTPSLLSLLRSGKHSIRDMAKILGISRSRVSWFIAELERRKWIEVTRCAIWFHDGTRSNKQNVYRVKL